MPGSLMTFYDEWLAWSAGLEEMYSRSPGVAKDSEIPWVETRHDAKVKLMLGSDLGFATMGGAVLKAEIPVAEHTGMHSHGEEALFVIEGNGFILIDGERFDIRPGSTLQIPYRSPHQLVNTGDVPLMYISALASPLEQFVNLFRLEQLEDRGTNGSELLAIAPSQSESLEDGRRVLIQLDEAPSRSVEDVELAAYRDQHDTVHYLALPENGFPDRSRSSVAITHLFVEPSMYHAGRHKHLEAVLYVLEGEGYSDVGPDPQSWSTGDALHIPPAMWEHEHYNLGDKPCRLLRIQFGIRYWFTDLWPEGYTPARIYDEHGNPMISGQIKP